MNSNTVSAGRYTGRLFVEDGRLHMVLDIDSQAGIARVSHNKGNGPQVEEWPISDLGTRLARECGLKLDGLIRAGASERITAKENGWYFTSREGLQGPFKSHAETSRALQDYILTIQGTETTGNQS